jgi:lipid-A-disaccharide synthase
MTSSLKQKIFIIAGEESGDVRGAELIRELKIMAPGLTIDSVGGQRMKEAGANIVRDITHLAVVGFVEVLKHYSDFRRLMDEVAEIIGKGGYSAIVLIDYPGFNLRLAERVKPFGIPVIYYISPQVWAWASGRAKKIAGLVHRMIVLFEFEKDFYALHGIHADFVGHPMVDMAAQYRPRDLRKEFGVPDDSKIVGFLPGSRVSEVQRILPAMLEAMNIYKRSKGIYKIRFLVSAARKELEDIIREGIRRHKDLDDVMIYGGDSSDVIHSSDAVVVASGTATLQTAIFEKPMVIVYSVSFLTWAIARLLVTIPYIGMVNVISGKKVVPELVQWHLTGNDIIIEIFKYFNDASYRESVVSSLRVVKKKLGPGGAAKKAAGSVIDFLEKDNRVKGA